MRLLIFGVVCFFLIACSGDSGTNSKKGEPLPSFLEGMKRISASNAEVFLGTNIEGVKPEERPRMMVKFDYDFYMAKSEATCGEFDSLMRAETGLTLNCKSKDLPATDVSYCDAILFANAKSKAVGKDTAYTYVKVIFDSEKHCTNIEGFDFHPEKESFRLPTEAEWVLAANKYGKKNKSWTSDNSGFTLHPVCSKASGKDELCDMIGNALELVNDWMGYFNDKVYLNYVGATECNSIGRRVVKGGSYRDSSNFINYYSRGDVYTVTTGTRAVYAGFRLAFGAIPNASWNDGSGESQSGVATVVANFGTVRSQLGAFNVKLAFRNDVSGNLAFVDYTSGLPNVMELEDTMQVYHPEISPDGKRVAFCTNFEGSSGKSEIYVRDLLNAGTGLQKLQFENAVIPRWRVLPDGDTVIVFVSDAGNNSDNATFMAKSTWQVPFKNGKFGTPQKLFDGAYHGGISEDNSLAVTGSSRLRARIASGASVRDTVWYNGEQACNASLAKDGSLRTMFLDFGSETGKKFVGSSYVTHERLLIADKTGKLVQSVLAPAGYTFDHSEWVSGLKNFAVVTLVNYNNAHAKIALVDVDNAKTLELVKGDELWHPSLWVDPLSTSHYESLDLDSAGAYFVGQDAPLLTIKMNAFWSMVDTVEILGFGSSRVSTGFAAWNMSSGYAFNMATIPCDMDVIGFLVENYALPHCKKLKYIIVSLDFDLWSDEKNYNVIKNIGGNRGFSYDHSHSYWKNGTPPLYKELNTNYVTGIDFLRTFKDENHGWVYIEKGGWAQSGLDTNPIIGDSAWSDNGIYAESMTRLQDLIELAKEKNVVLIGVVFPQTPYYKKTGAFGRHGMRRSTADSLTKILKTWDEKYSNFVFFDENRMGDHDYSDEMAYDYDHLSFLGAQRITAKLDSLIQTMK